MLAGPPRRIKEPAGRFETAWLSSGKSIQTIVIHHNAHGWITCQTRGMVDVFVAGEAAKH